MHPGDKDLITAQIAAHNGKKILLVKTQRGADRLADNLAKAGAPVGALHGGKSQAVRTRTRTRTLKLFNELECAALGATDVAARGIYVDGVSLVAHVDVPTDHKNYLHRSGRTARAGEASGVVVITTTKQQISV
jgi:superfamily II DNA/RNA helicase